MLLFYLSMVETAEDKTKLEKIYYEYKDFILSVAMGYVKNIDDAEDIVHDTMLRIINNLNKIEQVDSNDTKGFIYIIAKNISINKLNKKIEIIDYQYIEKMQISRSDVFESVQVREMLQKIIELPESLREPLELSVYFGMNSVEIAKVLGISELLVRKRIERARKAIN